jgi:hypothetical protein
MIDLILLALLLVAVAACGLAVLRAFDALPADPGGDSLVAGLSVGLGVAGMVGLGLAAAGDLRVGPLAIVGAFALLAGGRELVRVVRAVDASALRKAWPALVVCAVVLVAEVAAMLAPPVGGDQVKYHLVYPRLYAEHGGLVDTPWSFWGHMQFLQNFLFAVGFVLHGDVLARLLNGTIGVLAALALASLVGRHLMRRGAAIAGSLFFTLPITWSLMTRAGADLAVVLYAALAVGALLDWGKLARPADLRRAGIAAGMAAGSKVMGMLVPALVGVGVLAVLGRRTRSLGHGARATLTFGVLVLVFASPCYIRNTVETGNPIYPFGYGVFGGRNWSAEAGQYLGEYYLQYQTVHAARRDGAPYAGLAVARFPWDLTMHPDSFENAARQSLDIGPFALAFAPALLLMRKRRGAALGTAEIGIAYAGIIAALAWAHPRYVVPGVALLMVASIPAARRLLGRRLFLAVMVITIAGNLVLTSRLLRPLWTDQVRVAIGRLEPAEFLRRHSARFAFWERANAAVEPSGLVLVLEKVPQPYYIERPFVLASYLEQGMLDYRVVQSPEALAAVARSEGVTHVAVDMQGLDAAGDPFEASVARLWRGFIMGSCEPILRQDGYALYSLRPVTAIAAGRTGDDA